MKKLIVLALCLVAALAFAAGCKKKEVAVEAPVQAAVSSVKAPVAAPAPAAAPVEKKK
jgi:hypothetical protein